MVKISQYVTISTLADEDLFDTSQYDAIAVDYETRSITWEDIVSQMDAQVHDSGGDDALTDPAVNSRSFFYNATGPGGTMYLPGATAVAGAIVSFIRIADAGVAANIASSGGFNVNGAATYVASTVLYDVETFYFDGANWYGG